MLIPTNKMITDIAQKFGVDSKEAIKMRLLVVSYKSNKSHNYNDCLEFYKKSMKRGVDK